MPSYSSPTASTLQRSQATPPGLARRDSGTERIGAPRERDGDYTAASAHSPSTAANGSPKSLLKGKTSASSLRLRQSVHNLPQSPKATALGSPSRPLPATPTTPASAKSTSRPRSGSRAASTSSTPLPSPSPTKRSFGSPGAAGTAPGPGLGRTRKMSGLSADSESRITGSMSKLDTKKRSPDEELQHRSPVREETQTREYGISHAAPSIQRAAKESTPPRRTPERACSTRDDSHWPVNGSTFNEEEIRERGNGRDDRDELNRDAVDYEAETETTPKRGDRPVSTPPVPAFSGDQPNGTDGKIRGGEEDEKAKRRSMIIDGRRSGGLESGLDLQRLTLDEHSQGDKSSLERMEQRGSYRDLRAKPAAAPSRTIRLERQSGGLPQDIRNSSANREADEREVLAASEGDLHLQPSAKGDPSLQPSSRPLAMSRTSSYVRGDDATGLPGQQGMSEYPSANKASGAERVDRTTDGQETWSRASVKEDSAGSSASNRRRSGLPLEFLQGVIQEPIDRDTPSRRSTMHDRFATDSLTTNGYLPSESRRQTGDSLMRSVSMRTGMPTPSSGQINRRSLVLQNISSGPGALFDQTMPSRNMSLMSRKPEEWETGSMRAGGSSMGLRGTTDIDRAESRRRRAALLQSTGSALSRLTPSRPGTSLRLRDPMSEPREAPGGHLRAGSITNLRGGNLPEAPNSAPAHLRLHRQSLSVLAGGHTNLPQADSPLARYQRPMSRAATSVAGSMMMDSVSRHGGDQASRYGDPDSVSVRNSGSREFPLQGTPSRIYMTRLLAALRNASSSASRDMMEACLAIHEAMPPSLDESTIIRHKTQSTTSNADRVSGSLRQALDLVAQMTVECEISAPEEAQEIALAYGERLRSVLEGGVRESDLQISGMTELWTSMTEMVTQVGRGIGDSVGRPRKESGSSFGQSPSPSLYNMPRAGDRLPTPSLLGGASAYRPKRSSLDLRRQSTVAGSFSSHNTRPGSALLFRNPRTMPIDEAASSSGSSGTRTSKLAHRPSGSLSSVPIAERAPGPEDAKRHSVLSRLRTSPLRQTTMLPGEPFDLPNGSPPSAASRAPPDLRRQRSSASTATARAPFKPTATARAATTAVSQITASPAESAFETTVFTTDGMRENANVVGHRRWSSSTSSTADAEGGSSTQEKPSRFAAIGGAYRRLSGVHGSK